MTFRVTQFGSLKTQLQTLIRAASSHAIRQSCMSALKNVMSHLQDGPLTWGDPEFSLKHGNGVIFHGIEGPLIVRYAVYPDHNLVCIIDIRALPGSALDNP